MNLTEVQRELSQKHRLLDQRYGAAKAAVETQERLAKEVADLQEEITLLDKSSSLLNSLGEERQIKAQDTIEELVTQGLQKIFDDSLSFHIIQTVKAKSASVEFVVRTTLPTGVVDTPVMDARGGGLAATIGFLLRVVILLLKNGKDTDNILILDETFGMVSSEYLPGLAEFVRTLVDQTGIQILMVTHQDIWTEVADNVYRFSSSNGKTQVEAQ